MTKYYRLMLGQGSKFADDCCKGNFVGIDFGISEDLKNQLPSNWKEFNEKFIPKYLKLNPEKSKRAAGLACATLWMVSKGMEIGDILLCPNGEGSYLVGEIKDTYEYHQNEMLPHRRKVKWHSSKILRSSMSVRLQNSTGSIGTYVSIKDEFIPEIENLIANQNYPFQKEIQAAEKELASFALEQHLEHFLVQNWAQTELAIKYDLYVDEDEYGKKIIGKQIPTDTGAIDILAISKDKKEYLVIELKNNRASDQAVGQIQRYMGYVVEEIAEKNQTVKGLIIAMEDDLRIRRALSVAQNIDFWRYEINFRLFPVKK